MTWNRVPRPSSDDTPSGEPLYELQGYADLSADWKRWVPPITDRQNLKVGDVARLAVMVNGAHVIAPWVLVVEVTPDGYVGEVGGISNSPDWRPYGTRVPFTADNIIDL